MIVQEYEDAALVAYSHKLNAFELKAALALEAETYAITKEVAESVIGVFERKHPGSGKTRQTMKIEVMGRMGLITIGGGAPFIEEGTDLYKDPWGHGPVTRRVMHFVIDGEDFFRRFVKGVARQPFVEEGINATRLAGHFQRIGFNAFAGVLP